MEFRWILAVFILFATAQYTRAGVVRRSVATDEAQSEFERVAHAETVAFLNSMFQAQTDFFSKVKQNLPPTSKRAQDIGVYIDSLEKAIQVDDIDKKDQIWRDTFQAFNKSPLLLNNFDETGLSNTEYERILENNGLSKVVERFVADIVLYFWKMAKASGKVMEVTIDDGLEKFRNERHS